MASITGGACRSKVMCTGRASARNRLAAFALFVFLYVSMNSTLLEARILVYFAALSPPRQRLGLLVGALVKIFCCASIGIATYALFITHPLVSELLLNCVALVFLLEVDSAVMKAFRNSQAVAPFYFRAADALRKRSAAAAHSDDSRQLRDAFALFHTYGMRAKLRHLWDDLWHRGRVYLVIYVVATATMFLCIAYASGRLLYCLPEAGEVD